MTKVIYLIKSFRVLNVCSMLLLLVGFRLYCKGANFNSFDFWLLLLIVGLITSAGYLINDVFDVVTDKINKPNKQLAYPIKTTYLIYSLINILALFLMFLGGFNFFVNLILCNTILILFLYSYLFQKLPLLGNLIVAFLSATLPLLYYFFDVIEKPFVNFHLFYWYASFGFIITLIRELVKDLEDVKGDTIAGYKTLPIVLGVERSKWLIITFYLLTFIIIFFLSFQVVVMGSNLVFGLATIAIVLFLISFALLIRSKQQIQFKTISIILKTILFLGVLILFALCY